MAIVFDQMKNNLLIFIFLLTNLSLLAQQEDKITPISIGFYGPYIIQPGIKIGTAFDLKEWKIEKEQNLKSRKLFVSPQIAAFIRPKNHTSFILNVDVGYIIKKSQSNFYIAPSVGLGYLMTSQILSNTIDLSNGEINEKDRELRNYFLPTLNFELGKQATEKMGWFTKLSYGRKVSSKIENAAFFALELGVKFHLRKNNNK